MQKQLNQKEKIHRFTVECIEARLRAEFLNSRLRLLDLEFAKAAVLNSLTSSDAQREYRRKRERSLRLNRLKRSG